MSRDIKLFWQYILPSIGGMLIAGSFSIVDTIFIGRGTGKVGLAAIALTWPVLMLLQAFGSLFSAGGAVLIAQAKGANSPEDAKKYFNNAFFLVITSGIALTALTLPFFRKIMILLGATPQLLPMAMEYGIILTCGTTLFMFMSACLEIVRNDGSPVFSMILMIIGLVCNVFLDWLFIIYWSKGAAGAAWATCLSWVFTCFVGSSYFFTKHTFLRFSLKIFKPAWQASKAVIWTGIPVFGNMFSIIAMLYMHNAQSLRYGGVDGLAAYTVVAALESLGSMLMTGVACGVQPLTANMYGAGKYKRQNRFGNYGYVVAFILGIAIMGLSFLLCKTVPGWMGLEGNAATRAARGIIMSAPAFILLGVIRVAGFYYQSTGKIVLSSLLIYGDSFAALPLCLYTLPLWCGMDGIWLAMPASRILLFLLLCYLWFGIKFFHRKEKALP